MKFFLYLMSGIAWPVAMVWISYQFKGELRALLNRVAQPKNQGFDSKFETSLAEAEAKLIAIQKSSASTMLPNPEINSKLDQLRRIADISPRAAILEAWLLIEDTAENFGFIQGAETRRENPYPFVVELVNQGRLPKGCETLLKLLQTLRNQTEYLPDFSFTQLVAHRYLQLAASLSALILNAG